MAAPVVIDMGMAEPPEALVASMVEACQKAAGDGECHLVREAPQGPYRAIAILTWDGSDKVRIEVGLRREVGTEWRTRALTFQPEDVELERFRSVGFVVGTLASEEEAPAPPAEVKPPPPVAPPPKAARPAPTPLPPPPEPQASRGSSIGFVGTLGGALDEGAPRYGASVRGRFGLAPWIGIAASAGGSFRPKDEQGLALVFLDVGVGAGFVLAKPRPIGWELTLEAAVENFRADVDSAGKSDAQQRTLPVARAELDVVWAVASSIELLLGGNVVARPASTTIVVGGESVGSTGIIEVGLAAGARLVL